MESRLQRRLTVLVRLSDFGVLPDAKIIEFVSATLGSTSLESTAAAFAETDVGKTIVVAEAGENGSKLRTTVAAYVSTTEIQISDPAAATTSGKGAALGTDCSTALGSALDALAEAGGGMLQIDGFSCSPGRSPETLAIWLRRSRLPALAAIVGS
jgi:hypothetical protein